MAWDFAAEIHALTNFDADDTSTATTSGETLSSHATQWLTDGAKEVVNILSRNANYIHLLTSSNTLSDTAGATLSLSNSKGPFDQLNPNRRASSMSLNSFVISGIKDEAYLIIFDNTDQAYSPYLSLRFIN